MGKLGIAFALTTALLASGGCTHTAKNDIDAAVKPAAVVARLEEIQAVESKAMPSEYATIAYSVADHACEDYFDGLITASNELRMSKADVTAIGAAAATIMALAKSATKDIGIVSAVVGLTAVAIDNTQQYLYLTPYPEETKGLVQAAMSEFRKARGPSDISTFVDADASVRAYAALCSYSSIAVLAKQAISRAPVQNANEAPKMFSADETRLTLQPFKDALGLGSATLADDDYVYLEIISETGVDSKLQLVLLDKLQASVRDKVWDSSTKTLTLAFKQAAPLLQRLNNSNAAFAKRIKAIKDAGIDQINKAMANPGAKTRKAFDSSLIPQVDIPPSAAFDTLPRIIVPGR